MLDAVVARLQIFAALRLREFRYYWMGLTVQIVGQQMFMLTLGWLAFDISGSAFALGIVNGVGAVPRVTLVLFGGVLADRMDQRKLIVGAQLVSGVTMVGLAMLTLMGVVEVWHLAAASFVVGVAQAVDEPSRTAFFPRLLPDRSHIASAVPLMSLAWSSTRIVAPALAGFVIAAAGADTSFFLSAIGAGVMVIALQVVRPYGAPGRARGNMVRNLIDGIRYVREDEVFFKIISAAFVHSTFAMGYVFMLPVFALRRAGRGREGTRPARVRDGRRVRGGARVVPVAERPGQPTDPHRVRADPLQRLLHRFRAEPLVPGVARPAHAGGRRPCLLPDVRAGGAADARGGGAPGPRHGVVRDAVEPHARERHAAQHRR